MSRKFNTKKFIKDVLNDRYALVIGNEIILDPKIEPTEQQRTTIQSVAEMPLWPSFGAVKDMLGSSHTPACCLSKLRSSLEAGKEQLRVWLQYVCGVTEVFFNPSFGAPLVLDSIRPFLRSAEQIHLLCARLTEWFLWSPYGDSEMARNGFEDGSKWCANGNGMCYYGSNDVNTSRSSRIQTLVLPKDKNSLLEIGIINTSKKDISFVIIGTYP